MWHEEARHKRILYDSNYRKLQEKQIMLVTKIHQQLPGLESRRNYTSFCSYILFKRISLKNILLISCPGLSCMWYLVPDQELNQGLLHWEHGALATGASVKSHVTISMMFIYIVVFLYQDSSNCTQKYTSITLKKNKKPRAINVISNPPTPTLFIEDYSLQGLFLF